MIVYAVEHLNDYCVYELVDPRTGQVRYVGSTKQVDTRYKHHMRGCTPATAGWIAELIAGGHVATMRVVASVPKVDRSIAEQLYIDRHSDLLNRELKVIAQKPKHKTKHSLADVEAALKFIEQAIKVSPPTSSQHLSIAADYLRSTIRQRRASKDNPGRPKRGKENAT